MIYRKRITDDYGVVLLSLGDEVVVSQNHELYPDIVFYVSNIIFTLKGKDGYLIFGRKFKGHYSTMNSLDFQEQPGIYIAPIGPFKLDDLTSLEF